MSAGDTERQVTPQERLDAIGRKEMAYIGEQKAQLLQTVVTGMKAIKDRARAETNLKILKLLSSSDWRDRRFAEELLREPDQKEETQQSEGFRGWIAKVFGKK